MRFCKINGTGNDFIVLNNIEEKLPASSFSSLAKTLCERHMSIGADGIMIVEKSDIADFKMLFYNSDGSAGEMCGNGARCICRYGYEKALAGEEQYVETPSGVVAGQRIDKRRYKIKMTGPTQIEPDFEIDCGGEKISCSYIELGTPGLPHCVLNIPGLSSYDTRELFELGRLIRFNGVFPKGANVNFYDLTGDGAAFVRTYERGVEDFTYACGSGTVSVALTLYLKGCLPSGHLDADMAGGRLDAEVKQKGDDFELYLTGTTSIVAEGQILDEALEECI